MVEGQAPSKVEVADDDADAGRVVAARAAPEAVKEELPRTVTVTVAAAQVGAEAEAAAAVVVTGSVQLSPAMENLGVWA